MRHTGSIAALSQAQMLHFRATKPLGAVKKNRSDYGKSTDGFFDKLDEDIAPLAKSLRARAKSAVPALSEQLKWGLPVYEIAGKKGAVCSLRATKT